MRKLVLLAALLAGTVLVAFQTDLFSILQSEVRIGRQAGGYYLLPTSQLLRPWGAQTPMRGRPVDLAMDANSRMIAVLNSRAVLLLDALSGSRLAEIPSRATSYAGIRFRPGDREVWASETSGNGPDGLLIVALSELGAVTGTARIPLARHPVPAGIAFSPDGGAAFVALSRNNSVAIIDAGARRVTREVPTGMAPFGVAYCAQSKRVFVSNRGGRRPEAGQAVGPSSGSAIATDPGTGSSVSGTVTVVELSDYSTREVDVGLAPSALALSPDENTLAVANGHSDSLSLLDTWTLARVDVHIPTWPEGTLGSQPIGLAFARDGLALYAACGGNNAIAVIRRESGGWKVAGAVPAGWFPSAVAVDSHGSLRVVNTKGTGNTATGKGAFHSLQYEGSLTTIPAPLPPQIAAGTREVRAANSPRFEPARGVTNLPSLGIRHVFFIIKENRTYDQVFGDIAKGNGDPALVFYGRDVTPNHHALAEKYVLLDNFHTGGAISFDGHHWLMQAFVSDYVERAFAASPRGYAWNLADALTVSPAGFIWQGAPRPLDVRVYGEFAEPARWDPATGTTVDMNERDLMSWTEYWKLYREGKWQSAVGSRSGVPALAGVLSRRFPFSSTSIPDQIRAEEFLRELKERESTGEMPHLSVLTLNNDHTNGTRPGSPTPRAMVADNDLALGRIVEGISRSRFWPRSLILVVEDDAQDGLDHVDGHRTVALAIGPHIRRGAVDSNFYTHGSMVRTIQEIFQIPPKTRFAAYARPMTSVFTPEADLSPFPALAVKIALDEMNPPLKALEGRRLWAARQSLAMNWNRPDDIPTAVLNRILWWDCKGYGRPYPK